ncbi:MAG: hypothetical protein A2017_15455 [Lentisphaerae bacterium GWF2_44_16]|nr:MAG: hypothetical protein A2017_15455 [Lentisphaerae bacterium GWF2_44_16]
MKNEIAAFARFLSENDRYIILTHENPDGDALGSSCALMNFLRENGKTADFFLPEKVPARYQNFMPGEGIINDAPPDLFSKYSFCLCVDIPRPEKIGLGGIFRKENIGIPVISIDHHPDNAFKGEQDILVPSSAAAAEVVFNIALAFPGNPPISPETATLMMLGIVTDTNSFRFHNTNTDTLDAAARLLALKADYFGIMGSVFFSKPVKMLRLESDIILNQMHVDCDGKFAWAYLSEELLAKYGVELRDIEGLIDVLRSLEGTEIVALFYRKNSGVKFSLRSKNTRYSVGKIARCFNGGGHELAAGGFIDGVDISAAEKIILSQVKELLSEK